MKKTLFILAILIVLTLSACAGNGNDAAIAAVENYMAAVETQDADAILLNVTEDWSMMAVLEVDSFAAVSPIIRNLACSVVNDLGDSVEVVCDGYIETTYGNEQREIDLSIRTYIVVQEGGEWLVSDIR